MAVAPGIIDVSDPTELKQKDESLELLISDPADPPAVQGKKVELDLDDAPFLQAEREDIPGPTHEVAVPEEPEDEAEKAVRSKRKRIAIACGAALAIVIGVAVWWFFFRVPPAVAPGIEPEVIVVPSAAVPAQPDEFVRQFEPFVVPTKDAAGNISFLICKFSSISRNANLNQEIDRQRVALRDAIYFYLRGKDSAFLLDARNGNAVKADLLSIFNDYLTQGKLEDILFESYLSR